MKIKDIYGIDHDLTPYHIHVMLGVGWGCYLGSWVFNVIYYNVHPSAVEMWPLSDKKKLFMFGKDVFSSEKEEPSLDDEVEGDSLIKICAITSTFQIAAGTEIEMADNTSLSCSNVIPEDNTETPEKQVNLYDTFNTDADTDEIQAHEEENVVPERTVEEAEAEIAEYKLKVETLESEIAKLREELSRKT